MHWSCCAPAHNKDFFVFSTERSEVSIEEVTAWMLDDGNAPQQDPAGTGNCKTQKNQIPENTTVIMPPTSKKLREHIGFGLSVCASVRPSVRQKPCMLGF